MPMPSVVQDARQPRHLRRANLERLLRAAIERQGPVTRAELTQAAGLSAPTVSTLTGELVKRGLLREQGQAPSTGGRRPMALQFNERHGFVAGVVVGPVSTRLEVADLRGGRLADDEIETPHRLAPRQALVWLGQRLRVLLHAAGVPRRSLLAVATGLPGAVDRKRGAVVGLMPGFEGWEGVAVGAGLQKAFRAPVTLENDVNLAVLGERWRGAAQGHDTCAFVSLGVGIGAGIVVEGRLHRGRHSLAGEIALMCMGRRHLGQDFGDRGCLETLAGLDVIVRRHRPRGGGHVEVRARALLRAARAGERRAVAAIGEAATVIGMAVSHLSLVIDPSLVVLGGPLVEPGSELLQQVRAVIARIIPAPPQVVASTLADKAALQGAVLVATEMAHERLLRRLAGVEAV